MSEDRLSRIEKRVERIKEELAIKIRAAGLNIHAVRHAHGFHTPYWLLRGIFGLTDENHPVTVAYRKFLNLQIMSPFGTRFERQAMVKSAPRASSSMPGSRDFSSCCFCHLSSQLVIMF